VNKSLLRLPSNYILVSSWPQLNLNIKVTNLLYHWLLFYNWFRFWEPHFTTYQRFVVRSLHPWAVVELSKTYLYPATRSHVRKTMSSDRSEVPSISGRPRAKVDWFHASGGSMTTTFLNTTGSAWSWSPLPWFQKLVQLQYSKRALCSACT